MLAIISDIKNEICNNEIAVLEEIHVKMVYTVLLSTNIQIALDEISYAVINL